MEPADPLGLGGHEWIWASTVNIVNVTHVVKLVSDHGYFCNFKVYWLNPEIREIPHLYMKFPQKFENENNDSINEFSDHSNEMNVRTNKITAKIDNSS